MRCVETMDKKRLIKLITMFAFVDGGLYKKKPHHNASFSMNMLSKHEDYIDFVKSVLEKITKVNKRNVKNPCKNPQINISTGVHPVFTSIHNRLYIDGYKGIDPHMLKFIDWECLAIMYMCDGSLSFVSKDSPNAIKRGSKSDEYRVSLNMKRLSYGDQLTLKKLFKDKFDLEFNVNYCTANNKRYYFLSLRRKDLEKFMNGVSEYIFPSFEYKLIPSARRTPVLQDDDIVRTV